MNRHQPGGDVDLGDLVAADGHADQGERLAVRGDEESGGAIDEHRAGEVRQPREAAGLGDHSILLRGDAVDTVADAETMSRIGTAARLTRNQRERDYLPGRRDAPMAIE